MKIKLAVLFLILLFQELLFRVCFPLPELIHFNRINYQVLENEIYQDPDLFLEDRTWVSSLDTPHVFVHQLNEYGFRDKTWNVGKHMGKKRIAFIGDSFVEGAMADQESSMPAHYQQLRGSEVEVFNAGMNGTGPNNYLKLVQDFVPVFKPDELKLFLYSNDFSSEHPRLNFSTLNEESYPFYWPRLLALLHRLSKNKAVVFRWFRPSRPFLFPVPDLLNPFTSEAHKLKPHVSERVKRAMEMAEFNFFMVNLLAKETAALQKKLSLKPYLERIAKVCAENKTKLSVYYIPSRNQISDKYLKYDRESCLIQCADQVSLMGKEFQIHAKQLNEDCIDLGIQFFDFTPFLREKEKSQKLFWGYDQHMNFQGYRAIASHIVQRE